MSENYWSFVEDSSACVQVAWVGKLGEENHSAGSSSGQAGFRVVLYSGLNEPLKVLYVPDNMFLDYTHK